MPRYLILAQADVTANALGAWLGLLGEKCLDKRDQRRIVWDHPNGRQDTVAAYETLVRRIEIAARDGDDHVPLNQVVVLVDAVRPTGLSVVKERGNWENLVAMLILTFPEMRWVFGIAMFGITSEEGERSFWERTIKPNHNLVALFDRAERDPIFDPTELREWARARTNTGLETAKDDLRLPKRSEVAAAIDEEKPYAYLHGYTAYRFGFRADAVTTWKLMKERFHAEGVAVEPHGYWLLLEDMSLNFPDRERGKHLLHLESYIETDLREVTHGQGRACHCRLLDSTNGDIEGSQYRILVTTGQARDNALTENRKYLRDKATGIGKVVFKPASGMFDLWEKVGLYRKLTGSRRLGNAPDFCWPPALPQQTNERADGHGAPGKLMLVAETLIRRAEAFLGNVKAVEEAVQGAVLATDAMELTGGRTPTTAIEALSLKHQFEVLAECQFSGVEYNIEIKPRLEEIKLETSAICRWFHKTQRDNATLNAQMHIFNALVSILRAHNQFDEEQICMGRIRHIHNTLWMRQHPQRLMLWPLLRYLELLLSSFAVFVLVLLLWVIGLSVLYDLAHSDQNWYAGLAEAASSFFAMNPPISHPDNPASVAKTSWEFVTVSCVAILSGFFHLGVFISHLYSITSRK